MEYIPLCTVLSRENTEFSVKPKRYFIQKYRLRGSE
jgi:hypothetical protein